MTKEQFDFLFKRGEEMMSQTKDPMHDWSHVQRVLNNSLKIKDLLPNQKKETIDSDILKLSCAWHDISYVYHLASFIQYFMEAKRSVKIIKKEFLPTGIPQSEINLIARIVSRHAFGILEVSNKKNDLYCQVLQDADMLDFFNPERIKLSEQLVKKSFFHFFTMKILKPLFFNFLIKHKERFFNLSESILLFKQI